MTSEDKKNTAKEPTAKVSVPGAKIHLELILGTVAYLMVRSSAHRHVFVGDWDWLVMPPVLLRQFRIFRGKNDHAGQPYDSGSSPKFRYPS